MIGHYAGNELLARECAACTNPILPGQLYYGQANGGVAVHQTCITRTDQPPVDLTRQGLDR